jgi:hypothetical protein
MNQKSKMKFGWNFHRFSYYMIGLAYSKLHIPAISKEMERK